MALFDGLAGPALSAGVDEVGRGPLAGPVIAGAVILDNTIPISGLKDSKRLSANQREALAMKIRHCALAYGMGRAEVEEIDELNILRASHLAMQRAVAALLIEPEVIYVDGNLLPRFAIPAVAVVKGDTRVPEISAAAIIAKVARDREMVELARRFPGYGMEKHKGYATAEHLAALDRLGSCALHRKSFRPVRLASLRERTLPLMPSTQ